MNGQQIQNINTTFAIDKILSFSKNSLVAAVRKGMGMIEEDYVIKIMLYSQVVNEDYFDAQINRTSGLLNEVRRLGINDVHIASYSGMAIGEINVEQFIAKAYQGNVPSEYIEIIKENPRFQQSYKVIYSLMAKYAKVDTHGYDIYHRYLGEFDVLDKELLFADLLKINNALRIIHNNGIAHHDIKPDCFMFLGDEIVLCDFESAVAIDDSGKPQMTEYDNARQKFRNVARLNQYTPFHANIEDLYNVDLLDQITDEAIEKNVNLDALKLRREADLIAADYFSLGVAFLDIFMGKENGTCNYQKFIEAIYEGLAQDVKKRYRRNGAKIEALIMKKIANLTRSLLYEGDFDRRILTGEYTEEEVAFMEPFQNNHKVGDFRHCLTGLVISGWKFDGLYTWLVCGGLIGIRVVLEGMHQNERVKFITTIIDTNRLMPSITGKANFNEAFINNIISKILQDPIDTFKNFKASLRTALLTYAINQELINTINFLSWENYKQELPRTITTIAGSQRNTYAGNLYSDLIQSDVVNYLVFFGVCNCYRGV